MIFATAATMAGCATTPQFDPHSCKSWEETNAAVIPFILSIRTSAQQSFSASCDEGKAAALATLNARLPNGNINPVSAYVGKTFVEGYTAQSADTEQPAEKTAHAKATLTYYNYFLNSLGQKRYGDVLNALDVKPTAPAPQALPVEPIKKPEPKLCVLQNRLMMVCTPASTPAAAPSSP